MKKSKFQKAMNAYLDDLLKDISDEPTQSIKEVAHKIETPYCCPHCGCHLYDSGASICPNCEEEL